MAGLFDIKKSYNEVKPQQITKGLDLKTIDSAVRPMTDGTIYQQRSMQKWNVSRFGFNMISPYDLWALSQYADILQIIFNARGRETFRNGIKLEGKHQRSSLNQRDKINSLLKKANKNNQSLIEVFKEYLKDLDWDDNGYLLASKNYHLNSDKEIIGAEVEEVLRLNPLTVEKVMDAARRLGYIEDGNDGNKSKKAYFDLKTRQLCFTEIDEKTGLPNLQAHFKVRTDDGSKYYNETEILHKSLHNPSISYGVSPLFSLYPKVLVLITQDDFIRKYYGENKPPKGFLIFNTDNAQGLSKVMDEIREKSKQNPHEIYPIPFQTKDGRKPAEYIDMSRSLQEMQFTENRNEFRNQIGAAYGVSPIFQNDVSTSGGLNNEGLQITVTNRAVEDIQHLFNEYVIPFIFEQNMGVTDWIIELNPSEEEDESFKLDLETKELQNIKLRLEMGQIINQDENGKFTVEPGELKLEQQTSEFVPFGASANDKQVLVETPVQVGKSKKKENPLPIKEQKKFETALEKELDKIIKQLDLKKRPTEKELKKTVNKLTKNLDKQLKAKSANRVKAVYNKTVKKVNRELGETFTMTEKDRNMIEALKRGPTFTKAFESMSKDLSSNLIGVITKAYDDPQNFTIDKIVSKMKEQTDEANNKLRQIARTESSKISLSARKVSYEKTGKFDTMKFQVIGPNDNRTGDDSKKIINLVGKGKSWDEIVNIIQKVAGSKWDVDKNAPIPRPNWRHSIIKVVD